MIYLFSFITAIAISMAVIPIMARLAPRLGMIDRPDSRKVHTTPIPRVGGVGIVLGALVPIAMWLPFDAHLKVYLFGAVVLLIFGVLDDIHELGHYVKFIGQFIAVVPVVYYGDLNVTHLPFLNEPIPDFISRPFTVFAMVGMINAINHSDGLDGLAGGMSLLSLGCMSYIAFWAGGESVILIALATLGGVLGFLRYNTHPAKVFMGDGGSQFLGFTLGFLMVFLIKEVNPAISPALPALILGLPIVDILSVFAQRVYGGMNWFRASKNHIHHRLLQLGFDHYESVVIIYSVQIFFAVSAILLVYESDIVILSIYLGVSFLIFLFLMTTERSGWRAHKPSHASGLTRTIRAMKEHKLFTEAPVRFVSIAISIVFVLTGFLVDRVPRDIGIGSALLAAVLLPYMFYRNMMNSIVIQAITYITAAFVVYLETKFLSRGSSLVNIMEFVYFAALAIAIGVAIRYDDKTEFKTTPMDYLVIFVVLFAGFLLHNLPEKPDLGPMAVKLVVIFYGCELILSRMQKSKWHILNLSTLGSLLVMGARGLL